jgi:hypothetical protein
MRELRIARTHWSNPLGKWRQLKRFLKKTLEVFERATPRDPYPS